MGLADGLPVGLSMGAPAWHDSTLLGLADTYEQASHKRRAPLFAGYAGLT
jgi:Asp-tRNA(Asn)/Glu-tRNA(Gln) amidotransferase A subunit family amidase